MLLSVVIPFYNNALVAEGCLRSLCATSMLAQAEVILVDDGSSHSDREWLNETALRLLTHQGITYSLLQQPHQGAAAARDKGIEAAQGRFVWFVDADDSIDTAQITVLLDVLRSLPDDVDLLHTGDMLTVSHPLQTPFLVHPDLSATQPVSVADLLQPRSSALDHTTYIIRRSLLEEYADVRYPVGHGLLEDACFVLALLGHARRICVNATLRPYMHHVYQPSTTAGAWSQYQCKLFVADIGSFFDKLALFCQQHPGVDAHGLFFRRYRYVYLRVLAVKGCPWSLLSVFRQQVLPLPPAPRGLKECLLYCAFTHRILAALCRLFRKKI